MALHYFGGSDGDPEGWFAATGFGAPILAAGALGVLGARKHQPALCAAAGVALWPMCLVSIPGFPLIIPAAVMVWAALSNAPRAHALAFAGLLAFGLVAAFSFVLLHQDPATWTTPHGSGSSSNIVTTFEAALSLATVGAVLGVALAWTGEPTQSEHHPRRVGDTGRNWRRR